MTNLVEYWDSVYRTVEWLFIKPQGLLADKHWGNGEFMQAWPYCHILQFKDNVTIVGQQIPLNNNACMEEPAMIDDLGGVSNKS